MAVERAQPPGREAGPEISLRGVDGERRVAVSAVRDEQCQSARVSLARAGTRARSLLIRWRSRVMRSHCTSCCAWPKTRPPAGDFACAEETYDPSDVFGDVSSLADRDVR